MFPARHRAAPLAPPSLQQTCKAGLRHRGSAQEAAIHTLRHASATPLWVRGGAQRVMQAWLGHQSPRTTARDTPLTPPPLDSVPATMTALMAAR